jgi:hypothetical protein
MKLKTAGRATAAVAAFGTVLGPVATSLPASATTSRPAATGAAAKVVRPVKTDATARPTQTGGLCGGNLNFQLVASSQVVEVNTGSASGDLIQLYYNSTTRCVYAKYLNTSNQCGDTINGGKVNCFAVLVSQAGGEWDVIPGCGPVAAGSSGCISPFFNDAGIQTAASADRTWGLAHWKGKTRFF